MIDVSPGEIIDRRTIIEIKWHVSTDPVERKRLESELMSLEIPRAIGLPGLAGDLGRANRENFAHIETIAQCLAADDTTSDRFQQAVRGAFAANARRAAIKRRINEEAGWTGPQEVKTDSVMGVR